MVRFQDGARTHWHRHPRGQVLYIVAGRCRVGTDDGDTVELEPGDVLVAEPGERHWHGAAPGSDMAHLSVTCDAAVWEEVVVD